MATNSNVMPPSGNSKAGAQDPVAALMAKAKALKEKDDAQKARKSSNAIPKAGEEQMSVIERRNREKTRQFRWAWLWSLGFFGWLL